jgi:hypothetical protein
VYIREQNFSSRASISIITSDPEFKTFKYVAETLSFYINENYILCGNQVAQSVVSGYGLDERAI